MQGTEWDDSTPIDSLDGMRRAIEKNTRQVGAAVEYAQKTYEIVKPFPDRMVAIELEQRSAKHRARLPLLVAGLSIACSLLVLACEALR